MVEALREIIVVVIIFVEIYYSREFRTAFQHFSHRRAKPSHVIISSASEIVNQTTPGETLKPKQIQIEI